MTLGPRSLAVVKRRMHRQRARRGRTLAGLSAALLVWAVGHKIARVVGADLTVIYGSIEGVTEVGIILWRFGIPIGVLGTLIGVLYYRHHMKKKKSVSGTVEEIDG